jgi:plasmid rolling circle replication initiator protein Rep
MKWRARFFKAIPKIIEAYPNARFLLLTLTQRNCELTDLKETLQDMNKAWERLSKRKQFPAIGWIKSVEVTRSLDGTAHPHFHALLMVKPSYFKKTYLSQATWTDLWMKSLRVDYTPIVDVRVVKPRPGHEGELGAGLSAALLETLKYGVKESDLVSDRDWLVELTKQLHKTRAVAIGGVLRDLIREDEPEDLIHDEDNPDLGETEEADKFHFGWRERLEEYVYVDR